MRIIKTLYVYFVAFFVMLVPSFAQCAESPALLSIHFNNAQIEGDFEPNIFSYELILEDNQISPVLDDFLIRGDANLFITYNYDGINHQTGIVATLKYSSGSLIYTFNYKNAASYEINGENRLKAITCTYGEVSPEINDEVTNYKLYVPNDLTEIHLTPVTREINAYCAPINMILSEEQEPTLFMTVTASNGDSRSYTFKIKRVDKTIEEVDAEMQKPDYVSFTKGIMFYEKLPFIMTACAALFGVIIIIILYFVTRRITVDVYDDEEQDFYLPNDKD